MNTIPEIEIGIVEYRQIIKTIQELNRIDFSDYALTSLKRRIEVAIQIHNLKNATGLIERLETHPGFFETFFSEILVSSTEMFRDPTFWEYLRDDFFPSILQNTSKIYIWLPECISGDELYSLMILLRESEIESKTEVIASVPSEKLMELIKTGAFTNSKFETSRDNYIRYKGKYNFNNYLTLRNEKYYRDISLIKNVKFLKQNINFDQPQQDIKLIIYRNKLLYFNQNLQDKILKIIGDALSSNGFLAIGNKEQLGMLIAKSFRSINDAENVYKRL